MQNTSPSFSDFAFRLDGEKAHLTKYSGKNFYYSHAPGEMSHGIGFYVDLLEVELMLWMGVNP
jgi:hypothetical protein